MTAEPTTPTESRSGQVAAEQGVPMGTRTDAFSERVEERRNLAQVLRYEGIEDERVLRAIARVPRHAFVPNEYQQSAYGNHPLPIGSGQTISQPYIVAGMTELAVRHPGGKCLEIGTGSGYQAAVLAEVCDQVFSIEYLPEVAAEGRRNLRALGYGPDRVQLRVGDGYAGWPEHAPYDSIVVTAAPERVPPRLLEQLAPQGVMVIPIGGELDVQYLELWQRVGQGNDPEDFRRERLYGVRFVPFLGEGSDN